MTAEYTSPDPGDPTALEADFRELARVLDRLNEDSGARLEHADDDLAALELLFDLREALGKLRDITAAVEATAAQRMRGPVTAWPGFIAERKGGTTNHKWDDKEVAWSLLLPLATDSNGEVDDSAADMIAQVRDRILDCASISYWRVGALKTAGVPDPYRFRTSEKGRYTVHVKRAAEEMAV